MKIVLLSVLLVGIAFIALGIRIFFVKDGKFPETEVGRNKHMREMGITCARCDEIKNWNRSKRNKKPRLQPSKLKIDIGRLS